MLRLANVFDFAAFAKKKIDPLAWDYLDEGSDDEVALRDSRRAFDDLIIRPHFLDHDVSKIDTSITLFGKKLDQPTDMTARRCGGSTPRPLSSGLKIRW